MRGGDFTENLEHKDFPVIYEAIFKGKQNIPWNDVEKYLKRYVGNVYGVRLYNDQIIIGGDFPDEYTESRYTKSLRGALAKVKANAAQIIEEIIGSAESRRWIENKKEKHQKDAAQGWYRYDTHFSMRVKGNGDKADRLNKYKAVLVVRKTDKGMYLYDMINIKKEASTPLESE